MAWNAKYRTAYGGYKWVTCKCCGQRRAFRSCREANSVASDISKHQGVESLHRRTICVKVDGRR